MIEKQQKKAKNLKLYYLFILILGALIIAPTHIFPQPYFMYARFPHYLEQMRPIFDILWPLTFDIYHYILLMLAIVFSINILAITFQSRLRTLAIVSSSAGLVLASVIVLFFFFIFIQVNLSTSIIYGSYSLILLAVDLLTLKYLLRSKKRH